MPVCCFEVVRDEGGAGDAVARETVGGAMTFCSELTVIVVDDEDDIEDEVDEEEDEGQLSSRRRSSLRHATQSFGADKERVH